MVVEPARIGELEVIRRIGAGGFGTVYLASDRRLGRRVAVKLAHPGRGDLWREARAAARLAHPNVVAIHEIGEHDGNAYLVMEHVDGPPLRDRIDRERIPLVEALRIARELASAIAAAHREGIIHLDLTPSNVLLAPDGRARVVDFGLARASDTFGARVDNVSEPQLSIAAGTPTFMAPEQWRAEQLGPPADVWALGAIMHVLVTGLPPVDGSIELVRDRVAGAADLALAGLQHLPDELAQIIRACLHKDPAARPRAETVAAQLEELVAGLRQPAPFREPVPRSALVAALATRVRAERTITVLGPAGCGKTTLVASLVVALRGDGYKIAHVRPGGRPLHAIAAALRASVSGAVVATRSDLGASPTTIEAQVAGWTAAPERFAADLEDAAAAVGRFALVIDPCAELGAAATACVTAAIADDGVARIVLVAREAPLGTPFVVPPPSRAELVAMLEQPIAAAGYRLARGLAARVARDLAAHPTPLPRLATVGTALWEARDRQTRTIPHRAYRRRGPRLAIAGAGVIAAGIVALFAVRHGSSPRAAATPAGPQCLGAYFGTQTIAPDVNIYGRQDALAGISSDGKAMLVNRRDCETQDWSTALVELPGPLTFEVSKLPALAGLDPVEYYTTLASDGLMIVGTDRAHRRLLSSTRSARRRDDFTPLAPNAFAAITVEDPAWISHPVLSQDGLELFYTVHDPTAEPHDWIHTARRASTADPFPRGVPVGDAFTNLTFVTGLSADHRTIFVGTIYGVQMLTRRTRDEPFGNPNLPTAAPTVPGFRTRPLGDCTRLVGTCTTGCNNEETCYYTR